MTHFTTPDLYDEYSDQLQVASAGLLHFGKVTKFTGQAITIQCPNDNSKVGELLKSNGDGKVLVVDANNAQKFAFLGDNLAKFAIENNWQGIIVNGCVRDVEILEQMSLAIMARGCVPRKTQKQGLGEQVRAVSFLDITIHNGDWIYGDRNGLLVSKSQLIELG
ncbi:ribonuclease E activity regulator RraA [Pseudoalteromonas sp. MMG024]|uniref:ribonuclease E activity regulator RraA n=1 Tax=Pseudoalteromonas sp. MMG024 TaxID=2909980 RepID=UPI001F027239|nr:ribonuclease E activity regulator RraA [Pseudoalteromonas sp. MMG024]MCF6458705.1 ribonuclease E activity regulator RraA [Pseudoalteromonas sp. MMG024]